MLSLPSVILIPVLKVDLLEDASMFHSIVNYAVLDNRCHLSAQGAPIHRLRRLREGEEKLIKLWSSTYMNSTSILLLYDPGVDLSIGSVMVLLYRLSCFSLMVLLLSP